MVSPPSVVYEGVHVMPAVASVMVTVNVIPAAKPAPEQLLVFGVGVVVRYSDDSKVLSPEAFAMNCNVGVPFAPLPTKLT